MSTITLNGKTYDISDDLAAKLADEIKDQETRDLFEPDYNEAYYRIESDGHIGSYCNWTQSKADEHGLNANVCTDRDLMQQRAYAETLSRLLWRYAMQHGGRGCYYIRPERATTTLGVGFVTGKNELLFQPSFNDKETAEAAIKEVAKPFLREHPDFKWQEA